MNRKRSFLFLLSLVLFGPALATAQGTQVVEDDEVGVRLVIPKGWEWRKRESNYQRPSLFVNCMPEVTRNYPCYLLVEFFPAPPNQPAITDGDRRKWESWYAPSGLRTISTRDLKVAGYPAFEIVGKDGSQRNAEKSRNTYVLVPSAGRVFRLSYMADQGGKDLYDHYLPAIDAVLRSFAPVAKSAASPKAK